MLIGRRAALEIVRDCLVTKDNEEIRYLRRKSRMRAVEFSDFRWSKLAVAGTCDGKGNIRGRSDVVIPQARDDVGSAGGRFAEGWEVNCCKKIWLTCKSVQRREIKGL